MLLSRVLRAGASVSGTGRTRVRPILPRAGANTRAALTVTDAAVDRVHELMEQHPGALGVRIGVATRGCNGLTYTMDMAYEQSKMDEHVQLAKGASVLIDFKAQMTLLGSEMDYVENKLSAEFVFNNPNIKGTCGCGESFTL